MGVVIPHKMGNCNECTKDKVCDNSDKLVYQKKEFTANPNELKRQAPNELSQMLPKCIENYSNT